MNVSGRGSTKFRGIAARPIRVGRQLDRLSGVGEDVPSGEQAFHGILSMESPERSESIPAPIDQGSPFFKYLCGLSPIKPARSMHVIQTYAELSLPPPPAVFTSPTNSDKSGGKAKRGLLVCQTSSMQPAVATAGILDSAWSGDKENQPNQSYIPKSYAPAQVDSRQPSSHVLSNGGQQHLCPKIEHERMADAIGDTAMKFEYGDLSDYLADPSEGGLYAAASTQLSASSYMPKSGTSEDNVFFREGPRIADDQKNSPSRNDGSFLNNSDDTMDDFIQRDLDDAKRALDIRSRHRHLITDGREGRACRAIDSTSSHEGNGKNWSEKAPGLDQEAAAMAFLLAANVNVEDGSGNEWAVTQYGLPEFSDQAPDFSSGGRPSNLPNLGANEKFETSGSVARVNSGSAGAPSKYNASESRKDVVVGGNVGQRGVRRRCLDFETSIRRKSGGGSRKNSGLRSKTISGSSAGPSIASIPSPVLCERAVTISDATNSSVGPKMTSQGQSDVSLITGSKLSSPGVLRAPKCSSIHKSTDLTSTDQGKVDQSRIVKDISNAPASVGIPSGIGLHLNSLTGSITFSPTNREFKPTLCMASATRGAVASLLGMPVMASITQENRSGDFGSSMVGLENEGSISKNSMESTTSSFNTGVIMERSRMTLHEKRPISNPDHNSDPFQSLPVSDGLSIEGSKSSNKANIHEKYGSAGEKRLLHQDMFVQPNVEFQDEYESPRSFKKRRKSPTASGEKSGDGCKRCNCKKSKCLKLYCECFAAGTYCVGSCTCQDCFNKPDYGETVMSTRQQIESRNPLAFAPKIIHSCDASPKRGQEEIIETPVSARHKRGCNCKKSLCLKKYCECYQAGVGCSEGCQCEGCKNMYGRKEAAEDSDDKETASDALESESPENEAELITPGCHVGPGRIGLPRNNGKDLSPITPSFRYAGQGRTIGRVRSAGKKRSSSPLSQPQAATLKPSPSPVSFTASAMKYESTNAVQQTPTLQRTRSSPVSTPKLARVNNQLSPRWDGLGDICTLTPLPQPPLRPTPTSLSTMERAGASPSFSCQSVEPVSSSQLDSVLKGSKGSNVSPPPFHQISNRYSLSSMGSRTRQKPSIHRTPSAPCVTSHQGKDNSKLIVAHSGQISAFLCDDDDTPDFLKFTNGINSPPVTKSSSPKQKRVSPPHFEGLINRTREGRIAFDSPARSSPGSRSGRKFILQALPSLPPLIPLGSTFQGQAENSSKQG